MQCIHLAAITKLSSIRSNREPWISDLWLRESAGMAAQFWLSYFSSFPRKGSFKTADKRKKIPPLFSGPIKQCVCALLPRLFDQRRTDCWSVLVVNRKIAKQRQKQLCAPTLCIECVALGDTFHYPDTPKATLASLLLNNWNYRFFILFLFNKCNNLRVWKTLHTI